MITNLPKDPYYLLHDAMHLFEFIVGEDGMVSVRLHQEVMDLLPTQSPPPEILIFPMISMHTSNIYAQCIKNCSLVVLFPGGTQADAIKLKMELE